MVEVDNLGTNYICIDYLRLSFTMPCMGNLNANLGVKALSSIMIETDNS